MLVKHLLQHPRVGPDNVRKMLSMHMGDSRLTPLMIATSMGHVEVIHELQMIMDKSAYSSQNSDGSTVVHIAVKEKKAKVINALIDENDRAPGYLTGKYQVTISSCSITCNVLEDLVM